MSLLNDALRAAEQRQARTEAPAAYTAQSSGPEPQPRHWPWWVAGGLLLLLLTAGWWLMTAPVPVAAQVDAAAAVPVEPANAPEPMPETRVSSPEPQPEPEVQAIPAAQPEPEAAPEASSSVEPAATPAFVSEPEMPSATQRAPEPEAKPVSEPEPEPETIAAVVSAPAAPEGNSNSVKQRRETPEAVDQRTSRELDRLLREGRRVEARQSLAALTSNQDAPLSRYVVARSLLVDGESEQALALLPERVTRTSASLRLLRARALLADGDLQAALESLESQVPAVPGHIEYHVTFATLLHQDGRHGESARRWAELIAWDDGQAPWWVGLALALESDGQTQSARRAYEQAAALPGLPPALEDHVRQRLQTLRAG